MRRPFRKSCGSSVVEHSLGKEGSKFNPLSQHQLSAEQNQWFSKQRNIVVYLATRAMLKKCETHREHACQLAQIWHKIVGRMFPQRKLRRQAAERVGRR